MARLHSPTLIISDNGRNPSVLMHKSKLLVVSGPLEGKEFIITKDVFTIGSAPTNDLVLEDGTVSRRHCEIQVMPEGYVIRDLGSTNGTIVQGLRITEAFLNHGTEVRLGKTRIVFCPLQETVEYALSQKEAFGRLIGKSLAMRRVFHLAETYAPTDVTILIEGETGTGKDVLAEEIHGHSKRRDKPFVVVDCATLAKELIGSELFGHVKGSFTGATTDREGAFEWANGGTIFLDEIGDLSLDLQPQLLRAIERKEIRRIGSNRVRKVDVRILSATNKNMMNELNAGRFREDLYFRLSVVRIELPPLRKRKEDIPFLTRTFLRDFAGERALDDVVDFEKTMTAFAHHDWPGNVRELRNLIEFACHSGRRPLDLRAFLCLGRLQTPPGAFTGECASFHQPFKVAKSAVIRQFEVAFLRQLLQEENGNISRAARRAGIERAYLQRLIRKHGLR